ncbi:UbiA prenyltransferase family protein [Parabacteroides sp. AM08-6]|uniref:UbiA prenyltransferase family protein n=1 Tax=Parabacteroides sp. AM08-6 TaxID=2292053 RepID=UPI000EFE18F3|nr:UbiA prenyltransferase family protein [Parabacteroides sp. AM08-6]RHJ84376.1 prenyltransferase [Parabacteroides sp. AM08-6]
MKNIIFLLRPQQWLKNTFIFLPLFFGQRLTDWTCLLPCIIAFFSFSLIASSIYCFNDICDVEADSLHPEKCKRPIASGAVSKTTAYWLMLCCIIASALLTTFINKEHLTTLFSLIGFYLFMNIAYCIRLKQIALVDVFILAVGFVLRIVVGSVATGIVLSHWIVLMTFLLALFLAFAKRRDDVVIYNETGIKPRKNVNRYNLEFLNQAISILASITIVCYFMYTVSEEVIARFKTPYLYITSVFVLLGMFRYLQLTIVDIKSGSPTKVLMKDHFIQLCLAGWIICYTVILYL